jgi:DNA polymerase III subunit delta
VSDYQAGLDEIRPAYLIAGSDSAKIAAARARLRARAESEGGPAALETFDATEGRAAPDADAVLAAIPALSFTEARRYLLVDGVDRLRDREQQALAEAIQALPPDLTIVLIARGKPPAGLARAVEAAGGEVRAYDAPRPRELPRYLIGEAARLGFRLDPDGARLLVERMGSDPLRLGGELERLALWAGEQGEVTSADLEAMIADTSETAIWALSDALLERDRARALEIGERLLAQGENLTGIVYALASRLRRARAALAQLERGVPAKQVEAELGMHPFAARQLMARLRQASPQELRRATAALADLEVWCRGGVDYGDELAMTLALRRATA